MKNQIMAHANCHDANIDKWIENEAHRFVEASGRTENVGYGRFPDVCRCAALPNRLPVW